MFSYKVYVSTPPTMYLTIGVHARGGMKSPRKADVFERCVNPRLHESFTTVWQMGSAKKARQGKSKFLPGSYYIQLYHSCSLTAVFLLAMNILRWPMNPICMRFLPPQRLLRRSSREKALGASLWYAISINLK